MICNKCFEEIPDGSTVCPVCRAQLTMTGRGKKKSKGSLFGGFKKKTKKSGMPYFDENGNLIENNGDLSEGAAAAETDSSYGATGETGFANSSHSGGRKRSSQIDPRIMAVLVVSLIAVICIIAFLFFFMKRRDEDNMTNRTIEDPAISSSTEHEPESSQTLVNADSSASTSEGDSVDTDVEAEDSSLDRTKLPEATTVTDKKQNTEKSSFEEDTADSYFWPNSDSRLYTFEDLKKLSSEQIEFIRAEIYAREGCIFSDGTYNSYFKKKSWYKGTVKEEDFDPGRLLNYFELENVRMINTYINNKQ